jgi:hypothetical protein
MPYYPTVFSIFNYASSYTDEMYLNVTHSLSFSLPLLSPLKQFLYYRHVMSIYLSIYICIIVFVFWICLLHVREKMEPLSFWIWLTLLNMMISISIHLPAKWYNFIFLYDWIILHCVYVWPFLIHWSVVGHLGCFYNMAIVRNGAKNMIYKCILTYIYLDRCLGVVWLGCIIDLVLVFWGTSRQLSIVVLLRLKR